MEGAVLSGKLCAQAIVQVLTETSFFFWGRFLILALFSAATFYKSLFPKFQIEINQLL